jgi:ABC-type branched-subunit amino acid transport system substrate-binding protein
MKRSHRAQLPALAAVAALALVVSACSSGGSGSGSGSTSGALTASAPGITATTITIGSHQPLTGVAAPGYDEIAPASNAYFQWVNAHGGVFGRKIVYKFLNDAYDPSQTVSVVHQLVLQDSVYSIFDGLGTPTHLAVVKFLNSEKVPDVFVASGCNCWNNPSVYPQTFGWQLDYVREGKILGQYVKQHFAGKKIGYFFQNDEFGMDGVKGLDMEIPKSGRRPAELQPDQRQRRPAGGGAEGGRRPGRHLLLRPGLHRAAPADQPQAAVRAAARGQ